MKDEAKVIAAQATLSEGPQPGEYYRHYKGGEYLVVCRSVDEATLAPLVTYRSLWFGWVWTRTLADFTAVLEDGRRRFERIGGPS